MPEIRKLVGELGEPLPDYTPPKKDSVAHTACQTTNCTGKAYHRTAEYPGKLLRWFWEPNSFFCWPCQLRRGAVATLLTTALILTGGLILMIATKLIAS